MATGIPPLRNSEARGAANPFSAERCRVYGQGGRGALPKGQERRGVQVKKKRALCLVVLVALVFAAAPGWAQGEGGRYAGG
jgi:hypothetical protein